MCDHLQDTTSRYDAADKVLSFLLICRTCGTEQVVEAVAYEPRPVWTARQAVRRLAPLSVEPSRHSETTLGERPDCDFAA